MSHLGPQGRAAPKLGTQIVSRDLVYELLVLSTIYEQWLKVIAIQAEDQLFGT
jgi:hypothetical protein